MSHPLARRLILLQGATGIYQAPKWRLSSVKGRVREESLLYHCTHILIPRTILQDVVADNERLEYGGMLHYGHGE